MGFFSRLLNPQAHVPVDVDEDRWWSNAPSYVTLAGPPVGPDNALQIAAVWAAGRLLSETIASLPLITYRRRRDGGKERASEHPLYDILHDEPNEEQDAFQWLDMSQSHLLYRGNAYSRIVPGGRGFVDQLSPIHPDRVQLETAGDKRSRYLVWNADGRVDRLLPDEMFHVTGLSLDGLTGVSVITYARQSLGLAMAAESYGARFFSQNARPHAVLQHPGQLSDAAAKRISADFKAMTTGLENAHGVPVLEEGMQLKDYGFSNEDAQFLESRKFQISEVARWFRVPPHMIGDLDRATFSNIEHQALEFVTYSLRPWLVRWEKAIRKQLVLAKDIYFAEFLVDGLLRGDIASRYSAYAIARQWGWMSVNDVRGRENMNPIEGGDEYLVPLNMTTPDQLPESARQPEGDEAEAIAEWRSFYERNGNHD